MSDTDPGVAEIINFVTKSITLDQYLVSLSRPRPEPGMFMILRHSTTIGHKHFPKSRNQININLVNLKSSGVSSIEDTNLVSTLCLINGAIVVIANFLPRLKFKRLKTKCVDDSYHL